jgi:hypothetical protein
LIVGWITNTSVEEQGLALKQKVRMKGPETERGREKELKKEKVEKVLMGMVSFLFKLASNYVITGCNRVILMTDATQITKRRF